MKTADIKMIFQSSSGHKRKRSDDDDLLNGGSPSSKVTRTEDDECCAPTVSSLNASSVAGSCPEDQNVSPGAGESASAVSDAAEVAVSKSDIDSLNDSKNGQEESFSKDGSSLVLTLTSDSEEQNSSTGNELLNVSLSSTKACTEEGHSEEGEKDPVQSANDADCTNVQGSADLGKTEQVKEKAPRKKKLMTQEEAKKKTELRAQKEKEREQKRLEILAKKEEKRLLKEKREQEKKLAQEEKQRKKEQEEQERKEKERLKQEKKRQEEQQKLQMKEEKNRLKQLALEAKAEEKRKKEEQRKKALDEKLKTLEEKRKAEEEKLRIEQEKERKTKEAFKNFFVQSGFSISPAQPQTKEVVFRPFQVTDGMTLAPVVPQVAQERFNRDHLDQCLHTQDCKDTYLSVLKSGKYQSLKIERNLALKEMTEDDIILISDKDAVGLNLKAKLLQFSENVRPAYWGTWRKKSREVRPRNPFGKDNVLDYDVDSDDEWDEGGPGESLTGTEEEESEDDYEVDNEFFVPHGYLSAEEEGGDEEEENREPTDPEELKMRLKVKEHEFLSERKRKTIELKPIILGCFFCADGSEDLLAIETSLTPYSAELLTEKDIMTGGTVSNFQAPDWFGPPNSESSPSNENRMKTQNIKRPVPEEAMPFLIKLLHANTNSRQSVVKEFQAFWSSYCKSAPGTQSSELAVNQTPLTAIDNQPTLQVGGTTTPKVFSDPYEISKRQLDITIQNISSWIKSPDPNFKKYCWWVREETRKKYGLMDAPVPNQWNYVSSKETTPLGTAPTKTASEVQG